jgi:phage gp29-like protein
MIRKTLIRLAEMYLPTVTRIVRDDSRHDPPSVADQLTVDMLHGILDEARGGNTQRLFAVYRDLVLGSSHGQSEFNTRKLAVVGEHPLIEPVNKDLPGAVEAANYVSAIWDQYDGQRDAVTHLLDSCLWPVSVIEKTFQRSTLPGVRYEIRELKPVPYHLLDYTEGRLRIQDVGPQGNPLGTYHEPDPRRYIVHRGHLMTSIPDNFGGPMRAALFWWLFATMDRDWWIRFLERFGAPFIVGKYDPSDEGARSVLQNAFSYATRLFGLTVSKNTDIQVHAASTAAHGDAFEQFHDTAKKELSKLILGQTMTSEAAPGGIGGTQAQVHDGVRGDIRKFDALALGETLKHQLFRQLLQINGHAQAPAPAIAWGTDKADAKLIAETLKSLYDAGLRPTLDALPDFTAHLGYSVERFTPSAGPAAIGSLTPDQMFSAKLLEIFAADPVSNPGADAADDLAAAVARGMSASLKRRIRKALASSTGIDEFTAQFQLPEEADLAAKLLVTSATNALTK